MKGIGTHGKVIGVNPSREGIATRRGALSTHVEATNVAPFDTRGTTISGYVKEDGTGRVAVKVNGMLVHEFAFNADGTEW